MMYYTMFTIYMLPCTQGFNDPMLSSKTFPHDSSLHLDKCNQPALKNPTGNKNIMLSYSALLVFVLTGRLLIAYG